MKRILIIFLALISFTPLFAQKDLEKELGGYYHPDEFITLSETISFNKAVEIISKVSEKMTGKTVVSNTSVEAPIGVMIDHLPYKKALTIIVQYANLIYEERENVIVIRKREEAEKKPSAEIYADVDSREVKISAVFFEADVSEMKQRGINWQWLLANKDMKFGTEFRTFSEKAASSSDGEASSSAQQSPELKLSSSSVLNVGEFTGEASAMFRLFESENLGEIIACPSVTVRNMQKGRTQIGSDYSIKQRDFSGNITDKFFSTGSIVEVTPYIYKEDSLDYVLLQLNVERSSALPSEVSTEIKKTSANTQVLMLNGEETVIGGLYVNDEVVERNGIPILRDLPWWVLGIRYLTGSDSKQVRKKEVVILIKAELLPTLKERVKLAKEGNRIEKEVKKYHQDLKFYKFNSNEENR